MSRALCFGVVFLLMASLASLPLAAADSKAVQSMAGILLSLNHFPNDANKTELKKIVDDQSATGPEKTVAQAVINIQHKVSDADKPKLEALVKDNSAPESVKVLATTILNLNHTASPADKDKLKTLTPQ